MSLLGDDKTLLVRLDSFIRELTPDKFSFYRSRFTKTQLLTFTRADEVLSNELTCHS